jgi:hypothetical protein
MKLQTVPARQGAAWVRQGFRAFTKRPIAFGGMLLAVMFVVLLVRLVQPLVIVVLPFVPLVSLGFMLATRLVLDGGVPTPALFALPLRTDRTRLIALLRLGLMYAGATLVIMTLADLVDGGGPELRVDAPMPAASGASAASGAGASPDTATLAAAPQALLGLMVRLGLAGLLAVPFWHAPALVHWHGYGAGKALFSSTIACWRNRGAFLVYSAVWLGWVIGLGMLSGLLLAMLGRPQLLISATLPLSAMIATVYYASLYFTFADCFQSNDAEPAIEIAATSQGDTP